MDKKILASIILSFLLPASTVFAQLRTYGPSYSLTGIVDGIANAAWIIFTLIVIICFVMAAVMFLTAHGDATKLQTARSAFIWGIVGVIVGIIAYGAIGFVAGLI